MYCTHLNIMQILLTGQHWEVYVNGIFHSNQTVNNFAICGLVSGNNEVKIRRIKANDMPCEFTTINIDI